MTSKASSSIAKTLNPTFIVSTPAQSSFIVVYSSFLSHLQLQLQFSWLLRRRRQIRLLNLSLVDNDNDDDDHETDPRTAVDTTLDKWYANMLAGIRQRDERFLWCKYWGAIVWDSSNYNILHIWVNGAESNDDNDKPGKRARSEQISRQTIEQIGGRASERVS